VPEELKVNLKSCWVTTREKETEASPAIAQVRATALGPAPMEKARATAGAE
jgi:hypothetical protein